MLGIESVAVSFHVCLGYKLVEKTRGVSLKLAVYVCVCSGQCVQFASAAQA